MEVSSLVETALKTVATKGPDRLDALWGNLNGTMQAAEQQEPGNSYSASLREALKLLDSGVTPERLPAELRKRGL